jgi:hypothetical protein
MHDPLEGKATLAMILAKALLRITESKHPALLALPVTL